MKGAVQYSAELLRHFGPRWLMYRAAYALKRRSGWFERKLPAVGWDAFPLASQLRDAALAEPERYLEYRKTAAPKFLFATADRAAYETLLNRFAESDAALCAHVDEFENGRSCYFSKTFGDTGNPPDWHVNPFTGQRGPTDRHWSRIDDFSLGDIKVLWEPSRFSVAFMLVRAYWRTGDDQFAEGFWKLVESWRAANPPQLGVNWKCGQEASVRLMAWCFGLYGLADAAATTPQRVAGLAEMVSVVATRIETNFEYSLSQLNNHGIAESLGLFTAGLMFPELKSADRWRRRGRELLERQARTLIYSDGGFSQNSMNYHRVMMDYYLWCAQLGALNGQPLSDELLGRFAAATRLVTQLQDEVSGGVPCYGHNDGALVLPLTNCDYADFRPLVQASNYLASGQRVLPAGPWDEELLWLFGPAALQSADEPVRRSDLSADDSGYYTLRSQDGFLFTRCGQLRHRPAHADFQHVDIWWRGMNVACDPGTFSYNAPEPWHDGVAATEYHNALTIDGLSQMKRRGRWIFLPWATGSVVGKSANIGNAPAWLETTHDGYRRLADPVDVRRVVIRLPDDHWLVLDRALGQSSHQVRLHWLLADAPHDLGDDRLTLHTDQGDYHLAWAASAAATPDVVVADENSPRGWRAPYYQHRLPAVSLALCAHISPVGVRSAEVAFATVLGPEPCAIRLGSEGAEVESTRWSFAIRLSETSTGPWVLGVENRQPTSVGVGVTTS